MTGTDKLALALPTWHSVSDIVDAPCRMCNRQLGETQLTDEWVHLSADARIWYEHGRAAFAREDYHHALRAFGECAVSAPKWSEGLFWLGLTLARLGRYREALYCFTSAEPKALMEDRRELLSEIHRERALLLTREGSDAFHAKS